MQVPFTGCGTAIVTPMRDGGVDFDALARLIEYQIENGVSAIVPCGTTGEAPTLSGEEKKRVILRRNMQQNMRQMQKKQALMAFWSLHPIIIKLRIKEFISIIKPLRTRSKSL